MTDPSFLCELCHYPTVCRRAEVLQVVIWGTGYEKGQALMLDLCNVADIITMTATVLSNLGGAWFLRCYQFVGHLPYLLPGDGKPGR